MGSNILWTHFCFHVPCRSSFLRRSSTYWTASYFYCPNDEGNQGSTYGIQDFSNSLWITVKDLSMFLFILGVFLIPYGVVTTALLYPNEMRISESLEGVFFKPILTLYGELFLSEYTTYDFNDPLNGCAATSKLLVLNVFETTI